MSLFHSKSWNAQMLRGSVLVRVLIEKQNKVQGINIAIISILSIINLKDWTLRTVGKKKWNDLKLTF